MATIQGVYVALFGRPADPAGLAYFNGVTNNGADLSAINNLAGEKEYTDRFSGMNNVQIVNSIYQSLFGRDADTAGLNFFVDSLNKGTLNINNIAIAILDGAQGNDKTIVDAKLAAANLFTAALDTPAEVGSYVGATAAASARGWLAGITTAAQATQASAEAAVKAVVDVGAAGNTITANAAFTALNLTSGIGAAGDVKTTTNLNDTINAGTFYAPTTSIIDGGLGVDTLNATVTALENAVGAGTGTGVVAANGLKNIEILNLKAVTTASTVVVGNAAQLTQVWNDASTVALTVEGIAATTTVGLKGTIAGTTTFTFAETAGTNTANVALNAASTGANAVTIADTEIVNISNSGASAVGALTVASAQTIAITGSGSLNLGVAANAVTNSVDAAAFTGNLTFNGTSLTALKTLNAGTGNDVLTVTAATSTQNLTVNAGAGNDTINIANGGAATKTVTITTGDGSDIVTLGSNAALANVTATDNTTLLNSLVVITDFNKALDAIKVNASGATGTWDKLLDAELADVADELTLLAAATKAESYTNAGDITVFEFGGDAYILQNTGAGFGAGDGLIKVTGASVADFTATNFQVF